LGAAAAESIYAFLAFWGLGTVLYDSPRLLQASRLIGAAVMITLGVYLANRKSAPPAADKDVAPVTGRKRRGFFLGLTVTFLNPTIVVSWTMVSAMVHSTGLVGPGLSSAIIFALGVGAGIVAWFATLLHLLNRFQSGLRPRTVDRILNVTGWLVVAIGLALGARAIVQTLGWVRP
jgi:threonine/homoserine/homoserine lactone efflux protein